VGPKVSLDDVEKVKFLTLPGLERVVQPIGSRYTDCAIPPPSHILSYIVKINWLQCGVTLLVSQAL
jgi:hypothetical protein